MFENDGAEILERFTKNLNDHDRIIVNNARLTLNKNKRDYLIQLV